MFVFNPRWDMHSLRAKEIKDSPNSQAVPKILVLLKMALSGSTMAQVNLISPILTCICIYVNSNKMYLVLSLCAIVSL